MNEYLHYVSKQVLAFLVFMALILPGAAGLLCLIAFGVSWSVPTPAIFHWVLLLAALGFFWISLTVGYLLDKRGLI